MKAMIPLFAMLSAGCVSTYHGPDDGVPTATIVLSADEASVGGAIKADMVRVQTFADENCAVSPQGTILAQFSLLARGDDLEGTTRTIPAGSPFILSFFHYAGLYGSRQCTITYRFVPVQGGSYRAHFTRTGAQCNVSLTDASGSAVADVRRITPGCSK